MNERENIKLHDTVERHGDEYIISTVKLYGGDEWETMVFKNGYATELFCRRAKSEQQARKNHMIALEIWG